MNARAPSTQAQYANRWKLFSDWCVDKQLDPVHCPVAVVLVFLQYLLDGHSHFMLKVYIAAISGHHFLVDNGTVVSLFLRGALKLHPPRVRSAPVWVLPVVLDALCQHSFEPLIQAGLKWLSFKAAFLLAIISAK